MLNSDYIWGPVKIDSPNTNEVEGTYLYAIVSNLGLK